MVVRKHEQRKEEVGVVVVAPEVAGVAPKEDEGVGGVDEAAANREAKAKDVVVGVEVGVEEVVGGVVVPNPRANKKHRTGPANRVERWCLVPKRNASNAVQRNQVVPAAAAVVATRAAVDPLSPSLTPSKFPKRTVLSFVI